MRTPRHVAAQNRLVDILNMLMDKATKNEHVDIFAILFVKATEIGHLKICIEISDFLKKPENHPLHGAAETGCIYTCKIIMDRAINPEDHLGWTPLHDAVENGNKELCD